MVGDAAPPAAEEPTLESTPSGDDKKKKGLLGLFNRGSAKRTASKDELPEHRELVENVLDETVWAAFVRFRWTGQWRWTS